MSDDNGFAARLKAAMGRRGINQEELAKLVPAGAGTVNGWVKDGVIPSGRHMVRLPEVLGVSGHWLLTGEGPKDPPGAGDPVAAALDVATSRIAALVATIREEAGLPTVSDGVGERVRDGWSRLQHAEGLRGQPGEGGSESDLPPRGTGTDRG